MSPLPSMELLPGKGLGPFELGMTLFNTLNYLRSASAYGPFSVSHDAEVGQQESRQVSKRNAHSPHASPILLSLASDTLRLLYSATSQRLLLIELIHPCAHKVIWKGQDLLPRSFAETTDCNSAYNAAQKLLNSRFGPTYPPSPHPGYADESILAYPGVVFGFENGKAGVTKAKNIEVKDSPSRSRGTAERPEETVLRRMVVSSHNPSRAGTTPLPTVSDLEVKMAGSVPSVAHGDVSHVVVQLGDHQTPTELSIHFSQTDSSAAHDSVVIRLGESTSEDVSCDLGAPIRTFYKESVQPSSFLATPSYIYNYFQFGLDFVLSSDNIVTRIILHSNTPGEALFGRYHKVRWTIASAESKKGEICSEDAFEKIHGYLSGDSPDRSRPLILDRTADSGINSSAEGNGTIKGNQQGVILDKPTKLYEYTELGVTAEICSNGCVETVWVGQIDRNGQ